MIWPLAAAALLREAPGDSGWSRIHTRQALAFGILGSLAFLLLLAFPLLVVIVVPSISTGMTVMLYAAGILADIVGALVLAGFALWYSARAGRGELFRIPLVGTIADRVFRAR